MEKQRGFTLVEILIAVGIIALAAIGAVTVSASARSMAVTSAANRFDSLLDAARTIARESSNGVTIAFTPDAHGDGFIARLYHNRPGTEPLVSSNAPALEARVSITETETLGAPAFALVIHTTGAVAGIRGDVVTGSAGTETPCPAAGRYHFVLSYGSMNVDRYIACRTNLATNGAVAYASIAPATPQPATTVQGCAAAICGGLPAPPKATVTCPPRYIFKDAATCVDPPLTVFPRALTFISPGRPANLTYTVHEDLYLGAFHVSDNCQGAITDTTVSGSGNGPISVYGISALRLKSCTIVVNDDRGSPPQTISVGIGNFVLDPLYVCDPRTPPAPLNTDLGRDPDGVHEDISNGTTCRPSISTPMPTPSIIVSPSPGPVVDVVETEIIIDCDAGAPGAFFDLTYVSPDTTMGEVSRWIASGPKRSAIPGPTAYDPATRISATLIQRHMAPQAEQCVP